MNRQNLAAILVLLMSTMMGQNNCSDLEPEYCDGGDNDGDGLIDEGYDLDGDGFYDDEACDQAYEAEQLDCNDLQDDINPLASEVCDGIDNNCDDIVDEGCEQPTPTPSPEPTATPTPQSDIVIFYPDGNDGRSSLYDGLQKALDDIEPGGEIHLSEGTYYITADLPESDYRIVGVGDVVIEPQVDCIALGDCSIFSLLGSNAPEGSLSVSLHNLTLSNGYGRFRNSVGDSGGALYVNGAQVLLSELRFVNNSAEVGGALAFVDAFVSLIDVHFVGNEALSRGGAIHGKRSGLSFVRTVMAENTAGHEGGAGLYFVEAYGHFENVLAWNNSTTGDGGGALFESCELELVNSAFVDNFAEHKGGGFHVRGTSAPSLLNSVVAFNFAPDYAGESIYVESGLTVPLSHTVLWDADSGRGGAAGPGSLSWDSGVKRLYDPLFVNDSVVDGVVENNDFRLQSTSKLVDGGHGDVRYQDLDGSTNDVGIFGGPEAFEVLELSEL